MVIIDDFIQVRFDSNVSQIVIIGVVPILLALILCVFSEF